MVLLVSLSLSLSIVKIFIMPHSVPKLNFVPLHDTFGAECQGVDFSKPVEKDVFNEIYDGISKVSGA